MRPTAKPRFRQARHQTSSCPGKSWVSERIPAERSPTRAECPNFRLMSCQFGAYGFAPGRDCVLEKLSEHRRRRTFTGIGSRRVGRNSCETVINESAREVRRSRRILHPARRFAHRSFGRPHRGSVTPAGSLAGSAKYHAGTHRGAPRPLEFDEDHGRPRPRQHFRGAPHALRTQAARLFGPTPMQNLARKMDTRNPMVCG